MPTSTESQTVIQVTPIISVTASDVASPTKAYADSRQSAATSVISVTASDVALPTKAGADSSGSGADISDSLRAVVLEEISREFRTEGYRLTFHVFPLKLEDRPGEYWGIVTNGYPYGMKALTQRQRQQNGTATRSAVLFSNFIAAYSRDDQGAWTEISRLDVTGDFISSANTLYLNWDLSFGDDVVWIATSGFTGNHAIPHYYIFNFDGVELTEVSYGLPAHRFLDLNGDGIEEIVADTTDAHLFCTGPPARPQCRVKTRARQIHRWNGSSIVRVELEAPAHELPPALATRVERALELARAGLWMDASVAVLEASSQAPENEELRWLSILISHNAIRKLDYAGSPGQPFLTTVFAGQYVAAVGLMRSLDPPEAFSVSGPLVSGTAAEGDVHTFTSHLLDHTDQALAVAPERAEIHAVRALGLALSSPHNLSAAQDAMRTAAELSPDDAFYSAALEFLESVESLPSEHLSSRELDNAYAHYSRGLAYYKQGKLDEAIADFTKAIEIDPKDADAYPNRGLAYEKQGRWDEAISDYTKAIEIDPKDASAYTNRGLAYRKQGKLDEAIADYRKFIEIEPNSPKAAEIKRLIRQLEHEREESPVV